MNTVIDLLINLQPQDLVDIALLSAVIYWLLLLIKGTRTIPILLGLSVLLVAYALATFLRLEAISWVMENLFSSAVLILVVLFQTDIRNALAQVGISTLFRELSPSAQVTLIEEVVESAFSLARRKIGGTIVLENETGLRTYIERGNVLRAEPTVDLLISIFHTASPLHDGAVIIDREGKLAAARCILPLTMNPNVSASLGTRHRSGIGLSEETDAIVVIVSEETGTVSLAYKGRFDTDLDAPELTKRISRILQGEEQDHGATEYQPKTA